MTKKNSVTVKKIKPASPNVPEKNIESVLIENFVSLQKVMTNLAVKFDNLSGQISKLLELFEISAKTLAEKDYSVGEEKGDKRLVEKLDNVLEQNKIIAKGIALLHEREMDAITGKDQIPQARYPEPIQPQPKMQPSQQFSQPIKRINEPQPQNGLTKNPRFQNTMEI
jgi:hypothetical protein